MRRMRAARTPPAALQRACVDVHIGVRIAPVADMFITCPEFLQDAPFESVLQVVFEQVDRFYDFIRHLVGIGV